eukprot:CAMPEP_0185481828 /NCGR_PEP_ID=MMETSP1366-20130426/7315_1 /TAXON_ID=38817 /ORGANISM="Gephyrocapsa oceanica, Strain RCC1303" /LENGTH=255 /DNA_ID=CAMNT_0028089567 /DNA_START=212 /DNA_END=979 /DNA_ORIENTATION=-
MSMFDPTAFRFPTPKAASPPAPPRCTSSAPRLYLRSTLRPAQRQEYAVTSAKLSRTTPDRTASAVGSLGLVKSASSSVSTEGPISALTTVWSSITPLRSASSSSSSDPTLQRSNSTTFAPASTAITSPSRSDLLTTSSHPDVGGSRPDPLSFAYPGCSSSGGGPRIALAVIATSLSSALPVPPGRQQQSSAESPDVPSSSSAAAAAAARLSLPRLIASLTRVRRTSGDLLSIVWLYARAAATGRLMRRWRGLALL